MPCVEEEDYQQSAGVHPFEVSHCHLSSGSILLVTLIQKVSAAVISSDIRLPSFLCKSLGSLQLDRNHCTHPVT